MAWAGVHEAQWGKAYVCSKLQMNLGRNAEKLLRQRNEIAGHKELNFARERMRKTSKTSGIEPSIWQLAIPLN